ncbi:MAG: terminase family protein [Pyrinomonadaceae bacterium]|nr:terminase family protein [Pyrinomonadaceae bacterium]
MREDIPQKMIDDARESYLKHGGLHHKQIECEVRAKGWRFHRNMLYRRSTSSGPRSAWPERYGWDAMLTPEQRARLEQVRSRRAAGERAKFPGWLRAEFPEWKWAWPFQRHIYKRLASVTAGETKRLMIFMPPRHGKSEMVTIRYTAWRLLRDQRLNVILGSYNQRLADKFSRKIKRIVAQSASFSLFSATDEAGGKSKRQAKACTLNTASEWETRGGGVVRSVGVGGGIAGFGAGLVVIDDPVRNRADAESEVFRSRVWDWFNDDIYTRLEPDAAIILIQTRWHEDDLAGRLLKEMEDGGEKREVVSLPAIAESEIDNGELTMKSRFSILHFQLSIRPIRLAVSRGRRCVRRGMT